MLPPYPPLEHTWNRFRTWLSNEYPELGDTLNYGILPQDLVNLEMQFGFSLPQAVRESYLAVNGQEAESSAGCSEGLFYGLTLLPLEEVLDEWRFWREVDDDPNTGAHAKLREVMKSVPEGWVRKEYSQRGWIPLITDKAGNYVGVDINPGEGGFVGQVIVFGRDFDTKVVLWRGDGPAGWARWLASIVEELEGGEGYELGGAAESEGSDDGVGYESYFFDGTGRGSGDGNGEAGAGGLRLSGEYRGWNVLEAWADKSVRKWHESGLIPDAPARPDKGKARDVLDLAKTVNGMAAEVPIPVFEDDSESLPTRQPLPVISVTKVPAPLPVGLPTQSDIIPSPTSPDSGASSLDLESSRSPMMREIDIEAQLTTSGTPSKAHPLTDGPAAEAKEPTLVPLPVSPGVPSAAASAEPIPSSEAVSDVTDLLTDSAPTMDAPPMQPSPVSSPLKPASSVESDVESSTNGSEPVLISAEDAIEEPPVEEEDAEPETTVRLVGGAFSEIVEESDPAAETKEDEDEVNEASEKAEVASIASVQSASSRSSKRTSQQEKRKSISAGLKKLGHLGGGKRKKDSVSSVKETA